MRLQSYGLSHKGYVRETNEDCFAELISHGFFVLADGIGGLKGGALASRLATQHLVDEIKRNPLFLNPDTPLENLLQELELAIVTTHRFLLRYSQEHNMPGALGTTLVCLLFVKNHCLFVHIGDSRIYCLRNGYLKLLSQDDSLVSDLLHFGLIEEDEVRHFPLKHIITKSLGAQNSLAVHAFCRPIEKGDIYMLCSDGLSGSIDTQHLKEIMVHYQPSLPQMAHALQEAALQAGGQDNITELLVNVL